MKKKKLLTVKLKAEKTYDAAGVIINQIGAEAIWSNPKLDKRLIDPNIRLTGSKKHNLAHVFWGPKKHQTRAHVVTTVKELETLLKEAKKFQKEECQVGGVFVGFWRHFGNISFFFRGTN